MRLAKVKVVRDLIKFIQYTTNCQARVFWQIIVYLENRSIRVGLARPETCAESKGAIGIGAIVCVFMSFLLQRSLVLSFG